jgi:hypothetical protein
MASELIYRRRLSKVAQILQNPHDERRVERMKPIEVAASPVRNLAISVKHDLPERLRLHPHHVVTTASLTGALETIRSRSRNTLPARGAAPLVAVVSISERRADAAYHAKTAATRSIWLTSKRKRAEEQSHAQQAGHASSDRCGRIWAKAIVRCAANRS